MKTRGGKFLLLLGAGLAVMAFVVIYIFMSKSVLGGGNAASVPTAVPLVNVAVIKQDVPAYTILDANTVVLNEVEASTVASDTTSNPSALYGKMTLIPLTQGQQVRMDQLTQTGFSNILSKGERAFTLAVPERSTFGNAITENDRIDLVWTGVLEYLNPVPKEDGSGMKWEKAYYTTTKTLLQNVHVLRVMQLQPEIPAGTKPNAAADPAVAQPAASSKTTGVSTSSMYLRDAPYQTVLVLGVTNQQAEVIQYARDNGTLDLMLRSSAVQKDEAGQPIKDEKQQDVRGDRDPETTTGIGIDILIKQYGLPAPQVEAPK